MTFIQKVQLQNFNISSVPFRQTKLVGVPQSIYGDRYNQVVVFPITAESIELQAKENPNIRKILDANGLPVKVNKNTLKSLQDGHLKDSRIVAAHVYSALPPDIKKDLSVSDIQQAALIHDIGKALIPDNILNKKGQLTPKERKIMELHPILGYEILKDRGVKKEVLNLVKYHHQNPSGTGYPAIEADYKNSVALDVLHIADEYTALREERPYKPALTKMEAFAVISKDMEKGNISPVAYDALIKSV